MSTFITTESSVYHVELDLSNNSRLLFSDLHALKLTDGVTSSVIVGNATQSGYKEGVGGVARFNHLTGFAQINNTFVVAVDKDSRYLRWVNRVTNLTLPLLGGSHGSPFYSPYAVIRDRNSLTHVLVTDGSVRYSYYLFHINLLTRSYVRLISTGLNGTLGMSFDVKGENLLITNAHYVINYNVASKTHTNLTGSHKSGYRDGQLNDTLFYSPHDLISLPGNISLVADTDNFRLRLIDGTNDLVTTICNGAWQTTDGNSQTCGMNSPYSLFRGEDIIFIGEFRAIRILPCE